MDIVRCETCRKETYANLTNCPHCGADLHAFSPEFFEQPTTEMTLQVAHGEGSGHEISEFTLAVVERVFEVIDATPQVRPHSSKVLYSDGLGPLQTQVLTSRETNNIRVRDCEGEGDEGEFDFPAPNLQIDSNDILNCLVLLDHQGSAVLRVWNRHKESECINDEVIAETTKSASRFLDMYNPYLEAANRDVWNPLILAVCFAAFYGFFVLEDWMARLGLFMLALASLIFLILWPGYFQRRAESWKKERLDAVRAFVHSHIVAARQRDKGVATGDKPQPASQPTIH